MVTGTTTSEHERARARLLRKRKVRGDVFAYLVVNAFLVAVWAFTGAGYFWPGWILAGWGVLLVLDVWDAFLRGEVTEQDVQRELERHR